MPVPVGPGVGGRLSTGVPRASAARCRQLRRPVEGAGSGRLDAPRHPRPIPHRHEERHGAPRRLRPGRVRRALDRSPFRRPGRCRSDDRRASQQRHGRNRPRGVAGRHDPGRPPAARAPAVRDRGAAGRRRSGSDLYRPWHPPHPHRHRPPPLHPGDAIPGPRLATDPRDDVGVHGHPQPDPVRGRARVGPRATAARRGLHRPEHRVCRSGNRGVQARPSRPHCAMAVGRLVHLRTDARLRLRGSAGGSRPAAEGDSDRAAVLQRWRRDRPARLRGRGVDLGGRGHTGPGAVAHLVRGRASVCHRRGLYVLGDRTSAVVSRVEGVMNRLAFAGMVGFVALSGACSRDTAAPREAATAPAPSRASAAPQVPSNPLKDVYFGNFHVHTMYSFDAITIGCVTDPDAAYRWAKGETIAGGGGGPDHTITKPLDWYTVSDHAEYLGVFSKMTDPTSPLSQLDIAKRVTSKDPAVAVAAYTEALNGISTRKADPKLSDPAVGRTIWQEVVATANKHYQPGRFTTFPGFEWTSNPSERNLHRVVIFKDAAKVPDIPFSAIDSDREEDLWTWMDSMRASGMTLLAIPHNGNASDGLMFPEGKTYGGSELTKAYAETRMRNEKLYEVTQIKGTSETFPALSPTDEFANFEIWDYTLGPTGQHPKHKVGSYMRDAYLRGLKLEAEGKGNPFKYGLIGDSDTHNSASTPEEDNYTGKFANENSPAHRLNGPPGLTKVQQQIVREFSSAGLAAIWAESNTREALYEAVERKETYATSGPRMKLRVFGSFDFAPDAMKAQDWVRQAYAGGVPMGGDLRKGAAGKAPTFLIQALKEADGANLDRLQVVKGWTKDGKTHEKIFDVALSDGRKPDASGRVPPVGNTVNAKTASYTNDIGDPELAVAWTDPSFDPTAPAFYYVRLLQIPTPRWSTYDAKALGVEPRKDLPVAIQERAWSSPIWYTP